ncbi:MAG: hypothetical protein PHX20_01970 [Candidatus Omnitrophica bacterium]|nr:hypothetical protein [Candidatus Omnitrophota bacterium]MDD5436288.1 hypothetical protein [Candidatus Omnitrophota bacterium]
MLKHILKYRLAIVICSLMVLCSQEAFAWGPVNSKKHYYCGGRWYKHGWLGFDVAVAALTAGAIVEALPPRHSSVVVRGVPYYYYDGVYYRPCSQGYVVVLPPVVTQPFYAAQEAAQPITATAPGTVIINIPNSKGSYTPITLRRSGNGFIGPQGEYYSEHPTVEELKTLYG